MTLHCLVLTLVSLVAQSPYAPSPPPDRAIGDAVLRFRVPSIAEQVALSPDGRRIAVAYFASGEENASYVLEVRSVAGGPPRRLVPDGSYAPCVCDGGLGAFHWSGNDRVVVEAGYETDDGGGGESVMTYDARSGRRLSTYDYKLREHGVGSVRPDQRAKYLALRRAFRSRNRTLDVLASNFGPFDLGPHTVLMQLSYTEGFASGIWEVDLRTSRKRLVASIGDDAGVTLASAVRVGTSTIVLLTREDGSSVARLSDGHLSEILAVPPSERSIDTMTPVLVANGRLVFLLTSTAHAAGETVAGRLYETDGVTVRPIDGYPEVYDAASDASGRRIAVSSGETVEVRTVRAQP